MTAKQSLKHIITSLLCVAAMLLCNNCATLGISKGKTVVLDIGHFEGGPGAKTPTPINGKSITEHEFWYQYAYYTKEIIEDAGYKCIVINRGAKPKRPHMVEYARKTHVVHIGKPDETKRGGYASKYHPDRVAKGIVSADYALYRGADCVIFLHHNSSSNWWKNGGSPSLVFYNRYNGKQLADTIGSYFNKNILDQKGGMYNGGYKVKSVARYGDGQSASGWLNVLDDSGVPAAVIEIAFLNNRNHAQYLAQHNKAIDYAEALGESVVQYMDKHGNDTPHLRKNENQVDPGSFGQSRYNRNRYVPGAKKL